MGSRGVKKHALIGIGIGIGRWKGYMCPERANSAFSVQSPAIQPAITRLVARQRPTALTPDAFPPTKTRAATP